MFFAAFSLVPCLAALEAHFEVAGRADCRLATLRLLHIAETARRGAPLKLRI